MEAELDLPEGFFDEDGLEASRELRPDDEPGLVVARRVGADGRSRAYAWGRSVARDDLVAATERLLALSGQFAQRRLARPAHQLDLLDAFAGAEQRARRAEARDGVARTRGGADDASRSSSTARTPNAARLEELAALVEDTEGLEPGEEEALRAERERFRHVAELADGAHAAAAAIEPDEGDGARALAAAAEHALAPLERLAPELQTAVAELRELVVPSAARSRATCAVRGRRSTRTRPASGRSRSGSTASPTQGGVTGRRAWTSCSTRRAHAIQELERAGAGGDPLERALAERDAAQRELRRCVRLRSRTRARDCGGPVRRGRRARARRPRAWVRASSMSSCASASPGRPGPTTRCSSSGRTPGLPLAPVAETASGGELSRIALAIAAVAGGETIVLDEIDAGVGGETAHRVADVLRASPSARRC